MSFLTYLLCCAKYGYLSNQDTVIEGDIIKLNRKLSKGCYVIEVRGTQPVELVCEYSVTSSKMIPLFIKPFSTLKIFIYIQKPTTLTFKCSSPIEFDYFCLKPVMYSFAKQRLIKKILNSHTLYQGVSENELLSSLSGLGEKRKVELFDLYHEAFSRQNNIEKYYPTWYHQHQAKLTHQLSTIKIPILCLIDKNSVYHFDKCVESIRAQSSNPQSLLVTTTDGCISDFQPLIKSKDLGDVSLMFLEYGEVANYLKQLKTNYILILRADTVLHKHALSYFGVAVNGSPSLKLIYADSDSFLDGVHFDPLFKPDFDPILFTCLEYMLPAALFKKGIVLDALKQEERRDLLENLNALTLEASFIKHIPYMLASKIVCNKQGSSFYSSESANKSLEKQANPLISIIIPTRDNVHLLSGAVKSIFNLSSYSNFEIIIINNESEEQSTIDYLSSLKGKEKIKIIEISGEFNFSALNNKAVSIAQGEYICLLNNDVEVISPSWLESMLYFAMKPEVGCVGAKLYYSNDKIQHAGIVLSDEFVAQHAFAFYDRFDSGYMGLLSRPHCVSAVTGACLMISKSKYLEVGGLNQNHLKVSYNDIDLCLKMMNAGYLNVFTPEAELYHFESFSRGTIDNPEKRVQYNEERSYMLHHWKDELKNDPFYNKNFSTKGYSYCLPAVV